MARGKTLSLALAAALLLGNMGAGSVLAAEFDTLYQGGTIYTMSDLFNADGTMDWTKTRDLTPENAIQAEVVAVKDGKIVFVGSKADADSNGYTEANAAKVVNLQGKTMLPGFIDGHGHFPQQGQIDLYQIFLGSEPLGPINTIDQLTAALNDACGDKERFPNGVVGANYDDTLLDIDAHPTWNQLEAAEQCRSVPVVITHISGHMKVANKTALINAGVMNEDGTPGANAYNASGAIVPGVEVKDGQITGLLQETTAMGLVTNPTLPANTMNSIARANDVYLAAGVTTVDMGADFYTSVSNAQQAIETQRLEARVFWHPIVIGYYAASNLMGLYYSGITSQYDTPKTLLDNGAAPNFGSEGPTAEAGKTPRIGQDITLWKPAYAAYSFANESAMPTERIFQGAYKILGDGSPQGYTAWLKSPGYYDWRNYTAAQSATWNATMYTGGPQGALVGTKYHDPEAMVGPDGTIENVPPGDMHSLIRLFHKYGIGTEVHTNGTACAENWVEALEMAVAENPNITDTRHTSIHAQTIERQHIERLMGDYDIDTTMATQLWGYFTDDQYKANDPASEVLAGIDRATLAQRMAAQNNFASFFVNHVYFYGERHSNIFFGPGRAKNISPVGWAIAYGLPYSFHNDTFVTPIDPLLSVRTAVVRLSAKNTISDGGVLISGSGKNLDATATYPSRAENGQPVAGTEMSYYDYDQRINVAQALIGATVAPAWQNKVEDRLGAIRTGYLADFVILDDNPMQIDPTKIDTIRVATTIVGDKAVYGVLPGSDNYTFAAKASYLPGVNESVTISNIGVQNVDATTAAQVRALPNGETRYGMVDVTATFSTGNTGVLQMNILGNGARADSFQLYNVTADQAFEYTTSASASARSARSASNGTFWIADSEAPLTPLAGDAVLTMDHPYTVYFTMTPEQANTAETVRIDMSTSGTVPNNNSPVAGSAQASGGDDDSGGGCTIGSGPEHGVTILLVSLLAMLGIRTLRRRLG